MSDKSNEKISNLMDGELDVQASQFLLKRLANDNELSKTWENYHMIRSCLQKEQSETLAIDISQRVMSEIHAENIQFEDEKKPKRNWIKPLFGTGIAATVAFMSIILVQNRQVDNTNINTTQVAQTVTNQPSIKVNVPPAQLVGASRSVPTYLSRYPSLSAKESSKQNQPSINNANNLPYIYILNYNATNQKQSLSPLKKKEIAD